MKILQLLICEAKFKFKKPTNKKQLFLKKERKLCFWNNNYKIANILLKNNLIFNKIQIKL